MEVITKTQQQKKKKDNRIQTVYSRCLLTRKIVLTITNIGKNLKETLEESLTFNFEGKCFVVGYIKNNSTKLITIVFEIVFECDVCFPVEGMIIQCIAKNITKAGIKAESAYDVPSPVLVHIAKDHHYSNTQFNNVQEGDKINVRVIGQRFELNDKFISIIGELIKEKEYVHNPKNQRPTKLIIEDA